MIEVNAQERRNIFHRCMWPVYCGICIFNQIVLDSQYSSTVMRTLCLYAKPYDYQGVCRDSALVFAHKKIMIMDSSMPKLSKKPTSLMCQPAVAPVESCMFPKSDTSQLCHFKM